MTYNLSLCHKGYGLKSCEEMVNECQSRNPFCHNGGMCQTVDNGKAACQCKRQYFGKLCEYPVNPCTR